ncbi:DUF2197 domain-containing protein [Thermoflavimicrobium daqui]|jgi:uncharacterized protein YlaI|uniref:DUF2197 domain-containing protein n=1 Tax=Thermoflavimicrobium daqui TaxID=2137476 RepID=A0A364K6Q2_9BACL|nr:DUF2197 domain-containing protein [Thermoflavimicrobium daqui]RAL25985.1 hypothetical protein DL897_07945 [Thermoflavimicrobium daqui]
MKLICILCDQSFELNKIQEKKVKKHPHKIQICPTCYLRISKQVEKRHQEKESEERTNEFIYLGYSND